MKYMNDEQFGYVFFFNRLAVEATHANNSPRSAKVFGLSQPRGDALRRILWRKEQERKKEKNRTRKEKGATRGKLRRLTARLSDGLQLVTLGSVGSA